MGTQIRLYNVSQYYTQLRCGAKDIVITAQLMTMPFAHAPNTFMV